MWFRLSLKWGMPNVSSVSRDIIVLCIISLYSQFIYELNGALNWWWPFYYDTSQRNFLFDVVMISIWLLIVDQRSWTKVWYPILQFFKYMDSSVWVLFLLPTLQHWGMGAFPWFDSPHAINLHYFILNFSWLSIYMPLDFISSFDHCTCSLIWFSSILFFHKFLQIKERSQASIRRIMQTLTKHWNAFCCRKNTPHRSLFCPPLTAPTLFDHTGLLPLIYCFIIMEVFIFLKKL